MKLFIKILLGIVIVFAIIIVSFYGYYGGFTKIAIEEKSVGEYILVYEEITGDYKQSGAVMDKIYYQLKDEGIETTKGVGVYFDNPSKVKKENLRSVAGCILEKKDYGLIHMLKQKYKVKGYPKSNTLTIEFPYKGTMSVMIGIIRVYPKIRNYIKKNSLKENPIMEVYDIPNKKIYYHLMTDNIFR